MAGYNKKDNLKKIIKKDSDGKVIRAGIVEYIRHRNMQLGKVHLPCIRIHHAEIASVQISQGEYYFSCRYKDFFPEGERSFFVGGKLGERHVKGSDLRKKVESENLR